MPNTMSAFAAASKKAVLIAGFAASLTTLGGAVAAADSTGEGQTGAVYDPTATQGEIRTGSQGTTASSGAGTVMSNHSNVRQVGPKVAFGQSSDSLGTPNGSGQNVKDWDGFQGAYTVGSEFFSPQYR